MSKKKMSEAEQKALAQRYLDAYQAVALNTETCDRAKAEKAIIDLYAYYKKAAPKFYWVDSPHAGVRLAARFVKAQDGTSREDAEKIEITTQDIKSASSNVAFGQFEAYWLAFWAWDLEVNGGDRSLFEARDAVARTCSSYWPFEGAVVMCDRPKAIHIQDGTLHREDGPAIEYRDGCGTAAIKGKLYANLAQAMLEQVKGDEEAKL